MDNVTYQLDEIAALTSIYEQDWQKENETGTNYSMQISPDVKLFVTFVPEYPSTKPPKYEMTAPILSLKQKRQIAQKFEKIFIANCGAPVLFQWIETIKELLEHWKVNVAKARTKDCNDILQKPLKEPELQYELKITHGPSIQDRKSVFQGHACRATSQEDVKNFIDHLLSIKRISQAKHNISAFRIKMKSGKINQDFDDDGESHAGGRVLHLLQLANAVDVAVVVTRWYGGIHLGPDRFRHINNAARLALIDGGFLKS